MSVARAYAKRWINIAAPDAYAASGAAVEFASMRCFREMFIASGTCDDKRPVSSTIASREQDGKSATSHKGWRLLVLDDTPVFVGKAPIG